MPARTILWIPNPHTAYGPEDFSSSLSSKLSEALKKEGVVGRNALFYVLDIPPEKFIFLRNSVFCFKVPEGFGFEKFWFRLHPTGVSFQDLDDGGIRFQIQLFESNSPPELLAKFLKTWQAPSLG